MEVTVGVDVDDVGYALQGYPEIHPSIVLTVQCCKGF
jgi:hypothetical protein